MLIFSSGFTSKGEKKGRKNPPAIHPHRLLPTAYSPYTLNANVITENPYLERRFKKDREAMTDVTP
jgi:hypothetical protein